MNTSEKRRMSRKRLIVWAECVCMYGFEWSKDSSTSEWILNRLDCIWQSRCPITMSCWGFSCVYAVFLAHNMRVDGFETDARALVMNGDVKYQECRGKEYGHEMWWRKKERERTLDKHLIFTLKHAHTHTHILTSSHSEKSESDHRYINQ